MVENIMQKKLQPGPTVGEVKSVLIEKYGSFDWEPRYSAAFELVYTILSQHTSDINSTRAFHNLINIFGSLEAVAEANKKDIEKAIRSAGLFRIKAQRIKAVLNQIIEEVGSLDLSFLGEMDLETAKNWLKRLDGIGPKTAAIILCFSLGMPAMPVDTHIYRVTRRLGFIGKNVSVDKAHDLLETMIEPKDVFEFHLLLINHGRQVCKARRPRCTECSLGNRCPSREELVRKHN